MVGHGSFMDASGDELLFGGRPLSWWVRSFGLPLHLTYAPDIRASIEAFQNVLNEHYPAGEIRLAGKAATYPAVFRIAAEAGIGIDVASPYEARCALDAGVPPDRLDLNGNANDDDLLNLAIARDMLIVVDGIAELERVAVLAASQGRKPRAVLRLTGFSLGNVTASAIFTAGEWSKFGISLNDIPPLLPRLRDMPVRVLGFHTHIGSQITDLAAYQLVLGKLLEFGAMLEQAGHEFEIVNIGGGYPVSYVSEEEWADFTSRIRDGYIAASSGDTSKVFLWDNRPGEFELDADGIPGTTWQGESFYAALPKEKMLEALLVGDVTVDGRTVRAKAALAAAGTPALVVEPGRSIVSDSTVTLARVAFLKTVAGGHNLISLDLGVVNYGEALVALPARSWALASAPKRRDPQPFETFVAGNLCFAADMLSRTKVTLQRQPVRGDIVLIPSTGAYNPTFFASNANSFPRPARILLDETGAWSYLKQADTYDGIFSADGG